MAWHDLLIRPRHGHHATGRGPTSQHGYWHSHQHTTMAALPVPESVEGSRAAAVTGCLRPLHQSLWMAEKGVHAAHRPSHKREMARCRVCVSAQRPTVEHRHSTVLGCRDVYHGEGHWEAQGRSDRAQHVHEGHPSTYCARATNARKHMPNVVCCLGVCTATVKTEECATVSPRNVNTHSRNTRKASTSRTDD